MTLTNQKDEVSPTAHLQYIKASLQLSARWQDTKQTRALSVIVIYSAACAGCGWQQLCAAHRLPISPWQDVCLLQGLKRDPGNLPSQFCHRTQKGRPTFDGSTKPGRRLQIIIQLGGGCFYLSSHRLCFLSFGMFLRLLTQCVCVCQRGSIVCTQPVAVT